MLALLLVAGVPLAAGAEVRGGDRVIMVNPDDPEMNAAIAGARASLDAFWHQYESPGPGVSALALKVRIVDGDQTEHFWLINIERHGDRLSGIINNDPELVKNVTSGQRYEFGEGEISDWMYTHNGKIVGNLTARVLIKRMPADQAAQYRGMFEEP